MNKGERQIIAEKISSTVRILELLGLEYEVCAPRKERKRGNKSPRVVYVDVGGGEHVRIYNSAEGYTWANEPDGRPIPTVGNIEELYVYLSKRPRTRTSKRATRAE